MRRLLVNCNFGSPRDCTRRTNVAVIVDVEDDEKDISVPLLQTLISLNYDVMKTHKYFKEDTTFTAQAF